MNWLDVLIALIIFIPAFFGFINGFLRKLFGLAGIVAGFILAVKFFNPAGTFVIDKFHTSSTITLVIVFTVILCVVYFLFIYIAKYMANLHPAVNIVNKLLGVALGFLQGILISSILLFNLSYLNYPSLETRNTSILYGRLINIAPAFFDKVISFFPGSKSIYEEYKKLNE